MNTAQAMPNSTELVHRLHRAAGLVVMAADSALALTPEIPQGHAVSAVAVWQVITGIEDTGAAIRYACRVADPDWPSFYLAAEARA